MRGRTCIRADPRGLVATRTKAPPQIDKTPPPCLPEGAWCPHGAAVLPIINQNHMNTELHLNDRGNPSGTPAFASSFLPLNGVSVQNQPRTCATRVLHRAANFHTNFTSQTCTLNNEKTARVHGVTPSDTSSLNTSACSRNVLQNHTNLPLAPTHVTFSAPTSCQTDIPVWTAISTVISSM